MPGNQQLQDLLEKFRKGWISLAAAAESIEWLRLDRIGDFACIDTGRGVCCGMPEIVLAGIVLRLAGITGRCQKVLGFMPSFIRQGPDSDEIKSPLTYSIEKLKSTVFQLMGKMDDEIDSTPIFYRGYYLDQ